MAEHSRPFHHRTPGPPLSEFVDVLTDVDWVDVALSCGCFDQAHFNHDFRAFSGINPSTYLRHRTSRTHVAFND